MSIDKKMYASVVAFEIHTVTDKLDHIERAFRNNVGDRETADKIRKHRDDLQQLYADVIAKLDPSWGG